MKKLMYSKVVPSIILLKKAAPMLLVSLGMMFVTQLELWLVMLFSDLESVGSYSVVMRLIVVQNLPVIILTSAVQSSIVRCMANKDYLKLNSMISAIFVLVSFCMTLVCAFYWCWSVEIISLIFGDEYPLASELLPLRSISLFVSSLAGFVVLTLMLGQNPWQAMIASIIVIVINIALVPLLSPVLGAKSVVVAVLISSSISLFYVLTVYKAKYKLLPIIDGGLRGVVAGFKQFLEVKYV
jgi:O-antigen/teichoic acid export membrane protein